MKITVNFGLSNSLSRDFPEGTTVGDVLTNQNIMAALGYGDNVVAKIDGVTQDNGKRLVNGDSLDLEVRANTKAIIEYLEAHPETKEWVLVPFYQKAA